MLEPGTRIGTYEIQSPLGAGGMGEVYRARDARLHRDVAIKILPDAFACDSDRIARFEREAHVLASLSHPNIAAIYGIEEGEGIRALVLELVEGPTLADRIADGPVALDDAVAIAKQIAEALEAAHDQGVIHRDLKPANVKLTEKGIVKVLDFGLAKALDRDASATGVTMSPTITSPAVTGAGVILGTAAYMAPEQAKGRAADKRSDVWAFGCVLFEMLAGKRAFDGEDATDVIAAIVRAEPQWGALPATIPPHVRTLLRRCLEKERRRRIGDLSTVLYVLGEASAAAPAPDLGRTPGRGRLRLLATHAVTLVAGSALVGGAWFLLRPESPQLSRLTLVPPQNAALTIHGIDPDVAISPDGQRVVYVAGGGAQIIVRPLHQLEPTALSGLGEPRSPFLSPDGQWVGFFDGTSTMKRVAITGGPAITIAQIDGSGPRGATWGPDDTVIFASNSIASGLQRLPTGGGAPTVLTRPDRKAGEFDHMWPQFLPGGKAVLFTIAPLAGTPDNSQIAVLDLESGKIKVVLAGGTYAQYVESGHLVYAAAGTLRAVGFDLDRLETIGTPVPVISSVLTTVAGAGDFAVSTNGTLVYVPRTEVAGGGSLNARTLAWVDRQGAEEELKGLPVRAYNYARLSPDGARIAVDIRDQENDIWTLDPARGTLTRLTFDPTQDRLPHWMPDGKRIVFSSQRSGVSNLFIQAADGTGAPQQVSVGEYDQFPTSVTRDGSQIIVWDNGPTPGVMMLSLVGGADRKLRPLVQTMAMERNGELSPDGRWLAYESNASGRTEIYVRPFPDTNAGHWQISTGGGTRPMWSRSGLELFYVAPSPESMMSVAVEATTTWSHRTPVKLFERLLTWGGTNGRSFDQSLDGKRFLVIKAAGSTPSRPAGDASIVVVQNWFAELKAMTSVR
jgi:serine/threonine-protein kinase